MMDGVGFSYESISLLENYLFDRQQLTRVNNIDSALAPVFGVPHGSVLATLKGIRVVGGMAYVRNEIGPQAYVADEIITGRSGVRVVVTNTDAEGRMAMSDLLCEAKELALERLGKDRNPPQLFTIATLTGHALNAFGEGYSVVMENGPARKLEAARKLQAAGDAMVDMFEVSSLKREDYEKPRCPNEYGDVMQTGSSTSYRRHQYAGAFLVIASGLEAHGNDSKQPLAYSHLDIAGGAGLWLSTDPPNPASMIASLETKRSYVTS